QTNIDFYQVTSVSDKSVKIRPIASKYVRGAGWASEYVSPDKDNFTGEEVTKVVLYMVGYSAGEAKSSPYIKSRHGWISPCTEGKELLATHY
ncbi:hypothetical protein, partial [Enterococcus faecium]|uniref:hypothetical protein n=1 Tax=Enterococcus faecium TaxID=1352 RepID=UPI003DA11633